MKIGTNTYTPHQDQSNQRLSKRQAHKLANYSSVAFIDEHNKVIVDCGKIKSKTFAYMTNDFRWYWTSPDFIPSSNIKRGKWHDWQLSTTPRGSYPGTHNKR